jgi:hypothetical protein
VVSDRSYAEHFDRAALGEMILENLVAERIAIESRKEVNVYIGARDLTSGRPIDSIHGKNEGTRRRAVDYVSKDGSDRHGSNEADRFVQMRHTTE